jgi:hypothetical protein
MSFAGVRGFSKLVLEDSFTGSRCSKKLFAAQNPIESVAMQR